MTGLDEIQNTVGYFSPKGKCRHPDVGVQDDETHEDLVIECVKKRLKILFGLDAHGTGSL